MRRPRCESAATSPLAERTASAPNPKSRVSLRPAPTSCRPAQVAAGQTFGQQRRFGQRVGRLLLLSLREHGDVDARPHRGPLSTISASAPRLRRLLGAEANRVSTFNLRGLVHPVVVDVGLDFDQKVAVEIVILCDLHVFAREPFDGVGRFPQR